MGNIRRRIVGVMFPPSIFEACPTIHVATINPMAEASEASTFEDQCVNFRISMCRLSKIDVAMYRPLEMDVSTFEDR